MGMHQSSYDLMGVFRRKYLEERQGTPLRIYDLGSQDVNGSYRPLFDDPLWRYVGMDMVPGKNVDLVLRDPYQWKGLKSGSADVVISGQTFEHIEFFWITILEIARVLRPGGLCCLIAPSGGFEHRYPVDCWRFYPDGFSALARFARLEVLDVRARWEPDPAEPVCDADDSDLWKDCLLVARKPSLPFFGRLRRAARLRALHFLLSRRPG